MTFQFLSENMWCYKIYIKCKRSFTLFPIIEFSLYIFIQKKTKKLSLFLLHKSPAAAGSLYSKALHWMPHVTSFMSNEVDVTSKTCLWPHTWFMGTFLFKHTIASQGNWEYTDMWKPLSSHQAHVHSMFFWKWSLILAGPCVETSGGALASYAWLFWQRDAICQCICP